jgi:hypothetical protein
MLTAILLSTLSTSFFVACAVLVPEAKVPTPEAAK